MSENLILTYNLASLRMIRSSLQVFAMEAEDELAQLKYHESMMKIDDIIHNIDKALKNREPLKFSGD